MSQFGPTISLALDVDGVATLTLTRPDKRNALSGPMIDALRAAAAHIAHDTSIRAVVLAADGPVFCAGGDLSWMMAQINADRATRIAEARRLADMLRALNELPKPVIGRIHGNAFGGGIGLISVCDVVIAAEGAQFALTETRLGLIPATIGPYVIARMGEAKAREVFMSAQVFDAARAVDLGIVSRAVPAAKLDAHVRAEVAPYLAVAPGAVGAAKRLARALGPRIDDAVIDDTIARLADVWETDEARAGIAEFLDKRAPPWAPQS